MLPKILSQDSNYDEWCEQEILNAYQEAAECDEYLFGDYNYSKEWMTNNNTQRRLFLLFFMIHITDIYSLQSKIHKLKFRVNDEQISDHEKRMINKYLNEVLDYIDELRLS